MARKPANNYFELLQRQVDYACQAAAYLDETLHQYDPTALSGRLETLHAIEHRADKDNHEMLTLLAREFITPIEREDILDLAHTIDEVTDAIDSVLMRFYMFDIRSVDPMALEFCSIVMRCCTTLKEAMAEFPRFQKSTTLAGLLKEVHRTEGQGDQLLLRAVRALFTSGRDALEILSWREIYACLERCCDNCAHVAITLSSVVVKNT